MSDAITVHDASYNILRCNRAFHEMFPGADLCSVKCYELVHATAEPPEACPMKARAEPGQVLVWVSDEGIGIPPELLSKIFSRFYRVHNTATRKIGGSGLGLALVKEIVEAHGGKVWAESTLHQGSTFYFTLKVAEPEDMAA